MSDITVTYQSGEAGMGDPFRRRRIRAEIARASLEACGLSAPATWPPYHQDTGEPTPRLEAFYDQLAERIASMATRGVTLADMVGDPEVEELPTGHVEDFQPWSPSGQGGM